MTLQTEPWRAPWTSCLPRAHVPPSQLLKAFGVFLLCFLGPEKLSPLCLELSCEIATLWHHCVPTPTFYACNCGVSRLCQKRQIFFHFFIISGLCYFILMCTIYGILKFFLALYIGPSELGGNIITLDFRYYLQCR